jgi:hypothetical protein
MTTPPGAAGAKGGKAQAPVQLPNFRFGTQPVDNQESAQTVTLTTGTQPLQPYHPTPNAYLRGVWLEVAIAINSSNAAAVAYGADAPFSVINQVSLTDTNQKPIVGPITGKQLHAVNKFGGYFAMPDPRSSFSYTFAASPGAGASSAYFTLYVPLEIVTRTGLGTLTNKATTSAFSVNVTVEASGTTLLFATPPTAADCAITVTPVEDGYWQPRSTSQGGQNLMQSPPLSGTTQFWSAQSYNLNSGQQNPLLTGGLGYSIRNLIFVGYGASTVTRANANTNWPSPSQLYVDGALRWNRSQQMWQDRICRQYNLTGQTADAAGSFENGTYPEPFTGDFANVVGDELGNSYLQSQSGTPIQQFGSWGTAVTLYVLTNYIAPSTGNLDSLRSGGSKGSS